MQVNFQSSVVRHPSSVVGLVFFAFVLRVAFLFFAGAHAPLTGDELAYQQIAENVAAGRGFWQDNNPFFPGQILYAWQAPLYPLALGALYSFFGNSLLLARLFGLVVSTATVYVVYDLARRVFQSDFSTRIAFAAAFLVAIYPGFLTHAHLLLSETLFIFLVLLAFDFVAMAFTRKNARAWLWIFFAGALWGLATLTRGITLYFTPLFALWIAVVLWRKQQGDHVTGDHVTGDHVTGDHGTGDHKGSPLRDGIVSAILFVVATLLVIAPWTARNYFQFGNVVLLETKGGVNLWLGNSPYTPNDFIRNVWKVGVREPMLENLPTEELTRDRAAYALALNYIRSEPLTFMARMPVKFADFWGFERNAIDVAAATTRGEGWNSFSKIAADALAIVVYFFVMGSGVAGFIFSENEKWKILFGGFVFYFLLIHLVIFGDGRFHLPLIPFFALYAGWLAVMFRRVPISRARVACALVCIAVLVVVWAREAWVAFQILRAG